VILTTARISLRELTDDDLDFVAAMLADPVVMRHYPAVLDREQSRVWIHRQRDRYACDGHGLWLALDRGTHDLLGQVGLLRQACDGEFLPEVGYLLDRAHWGRGFATEAARAVRDHAFQALGATRVISLIRPANLPSQRVAARNGMHVWKDATHAGLLHRVFAITRDEWVERQARGEA
jgi:RimJ/RimL family protein N-acetyltransferase